MSPTETKHGCCVDGDCTDKTCMALPSGTTCGDCVHIGRCNAMFGRVETDGDCDWFPRKFSPRRKGLPQGHLLGKP